MGKIRLLNNLTGEYIEYDEPEQEAISEQLSPALLEAQYKARVADLIHLQYSSDREAGLQNDALAALLAGQPAPDTYLALLEYREQCKDRAYLEVYGVER